MAYYVPGTVLGCGDTAVNKRETKIPAFMKVTIYLGKRENKQISKQTL